ncbi:two-component sensor histidine kinase [Aeromicrobium flavum]|uniref:Two-component sensor histidine kinase n=1 Tax=Aeromicrobium flavum TaxID=416568 RepID=A0A512HRC4_9ACTN|nr:sensor histidine kinase [Aeromicrobium flavum]GEO88001.1 two-component sensor histidine kinase [Aeromicrobium flavum]
MSTTFPTPSVERLRWGLDVLVLALALVVAVRAVLLGESNAGAVVALVVAFGSLYVVRSRTRSSGMRSGLLVALVADWAGLVLLGADAAYVSLGLFLVFLTELAWAPALACIITLTTADAIVGFFREESAEVFLAPVLGAVLSVLLGAGYRVLFDVTRSQQELIGALQRTQAELAESERAAGQAMERQRLAREIHDTVAQGLSSIQLLLHAAEAEPLPERATSRVRLARETAAASLVEARRMVEELAPADLVGSSLSAALQRVCDRSVADVRFVVDGEPQTISTPTEAALVRVTQSALANVEQHAGPGVRAVVTLSWGGGRVRLDIVDDGRGFDTSILASATSRSFGLETMTQRVEELGGDWSVESEPGRTAVGVSFPVEQED